MEWLKANRKQSRPGMPKDPVSRELPNSTKTERTNENKTKRELLFDSSSEDEAVSSSGDEMNKAALSKMTEVEREAYIFEREQVKQAKKERLELKKRIMKMERQESESTSLSKQSAFEHKLRKMEQLRDSKKKRRESLDSDYTESEDESLTVPKNHFKTKEIALEDILSIQIKRDQIEKGLFRSSFANAIQGCFARVNVGRSKGDTPVYRMCQVSKTIIGHKSYLIGKTSTTIRAVLSIGSSNRESSLDIISNGPITREEFDFWVSNSGKVGLPSLTARFLQRKRHELNEFINNPVDEEELKEIIEKKKASGNIAINVAAEKAKLIMELEDAKSAGNNHAVNQIHAKLLALDSDRQEPATLVSNYSQPRKLFTGSDVNTLSNSGELDPFMRRRCKPSDIHFSESGNNQTDNQVRSELLPKIDSSHSSKKASLDELAAAHTNIDLDLDI